MSGPTKLSPRLKQTLSPGLRVTVVKFVRVCHGAVLDVPALPSRPATESTKKVHALHTAAPVLLEQLAVPPQGSGIHGSSMHVPEPYGNSIVPGPQLVGAIALTDGGVASALLPASAGTPASPPPLPAVVEHAAAHQIPKLAHNNIDGFAPPGYSR